MSDDLKEEIKELKDIIVNMARPSSNWIKYASFTLTFLILSAGIVTAWATNDSTLVQVQKDVEKIVAVNDKQEETIQDVKLKAVQESSDLKSVKEDVAEIKQDVKTLLGVR